MARRARVIGEESKSYRFIAAGRTAGGRRVSFGFTRFMQTRYTRRAFLNSQWHASLGPPDLASVRRSRKFACGLSHSGFWQSAANSRVLPRRSMTDPSGAEAIGLFDRSIFRRGSDTSLSDTCFPFNTRVTRREISRSLSSIYFASGNSYSSCTFSLFLSLDLAREIETVMLLTARRKSIFNPLHGQPS